jgi:hypothetical protein
VKNQKNAGGECVNNVHQNQKMYEKLPFYLFCAIAQ